MDVSVKSCTVVSRPGSCKKWILETFKHEGNGGESLTLATLNPEDPGLVTFMGLRRGLTKKTTIFDEIRAARCSASFEAMEPVHTVPLRDHTAWRKRTERVDLLLQSLTPPMLQADPD